MRARAQRQDFSISGFVAAREATERLLHELGLRNYLFDVEPLDDGWEVRLECQSPEGWKTMRMTIAGQLLEQSRDDSATRSQLLAAFRSHFGACTAGEQPS